LKAARGANSFRAIDPVPIIMGIWGSAQCCGVAAVRKIKIAGPEGSAVKGNRTRLWTTLFPFAELVTMLLCAGESG
jgi:hypothetical protein